MHYKDILSLGFTANFDFGHDVRTVHSFLVAQMFGLQESPLRLSKSNIFYKKRIPVLFSFS